MTQGTKRFAGIVLLAPGLPAFAQKPSAPTPASAPASQAEPNVSAPGDPTWMVADVGIALVVGLVVGYLIGAWRSSAKQRASHA
jgi:hypothetical protein